MPTVELSEQEWQAVIARLAQTDVLMMKISSQIARQQQMKGYRKEGNSHDIPTQSEPGSGL
jgi:hypothetical protein